MLFGIYQDIVDLNGLSKRINLNSESVESFRKLLQQQDCSEFGEGCRRCRGGTCRGCYNGYTLVYDEVNGYDICVYEDPATPSPTSATPAPVTNSPTSPSPSPTLPTSSPTPRTPAPTLPTGQPTFRPTDTPLPAETGGECVRYRKAWHTLTDEERLLYIDGFLELHSQGIILTMSDMHLDNFVGGGFHAAHGSPAFLPWHRYYIWEVK